MEEEYIMMMMLESNEEESVYELPPGCRFCPTKQELIKRYLYKKVVGEALPVSNVIVEKTLYGRGAEEPSQIFAGSSEEYLYFFTLVNKKFDNVNGKKMNRVAGEGRWEMQNNHPVFGNPPYETTIIGRDKTFNFIKDADKKLEKKTSKIKGGNKRSNTKEEKISWVMHEYTLEYDPSHKQQAEWTVCKIRKKISNKDKDVSKPKRKRARTSKTTKPSDVRLLQQDHNQYLPTLVVVPNQQKTAQPHPESQPCTHLYDDSSESETDSYESEADSYESEADWISCAMAYTPFAGDDSYESETDSISRALTDTPFAGALPLISEAEYSQPIQTYHPSPHDHIDDQPVYHCDYNGDAIFSSDALGPMNNMLSFTDLLLAGDDMDMLQLEQV